MYRAADAEVARRPGLSCAMSGRCCRFREAGHELWLTRLEYDEMLEGPAPLPRADGACPWLKDGLCSNREHRALACRTYFCSDEESAAEVTETFHRRIRELHARFGVPYDYRSLAGHVA